jgi:hypothetical protein
MTQWTTHTPKFDGDAPEGVTLETHWIQRRYIGHGSAWDDMRERDNYLMNCEHRYLPRNPPATYEQVVAWCKANNRDVPAPPIDYEAWRPVLDAFEGWKAETPLDEADKTKIDEWIRAFKLAMTIPACREVIEG